MKRLFEIALLASSLVVGCGGDDATAPDEIGSAEEALAPTPMSPTAIEAGGPNLRFVGGLTVTNGSQTFTMNPGGTYSLPCAFGPARITHRYGNGGALGAGNHANQFRAGAFVLAPKAQLPLASGFSRMVTDSFNFLQLAPNVPHTMGVRLDVLGQVVETSELDNALAVTVRRVCP